MTVGIGGNDIGFVGVAFDCINLLPAPLGKPCTPRFTAGGVDQVSLEIAATAPKIAASLQEIRRRAPNATVLLVGYPTSFPEFSNGCWPYVPILPQDIPYLRAKYKEMNAMLAAQAAANGATYVDVYSSSVGHDVCQLPGTAWVNGAVIVPLSFFGHPNALGMQNTAAHVAAAAKAAGFNPA